MRTETITWQTEGGTEVSVVVSLERKIRHTGTNEWTGEALTRDEGLAVVTTAKVESMGYSERARINYCVHPDHKALGYVATIGKLGLTKDVLDRIEAATETVMADPAMVAQEEAREEHMAELDAIDESRRRIEEAL